MLLLVGWLKDHFATKLRVETYPDSEASGGLLLSLCSAVCREAAYIDKMFSTAGSEAKIKAKGFWYQESSSVSQYFDNQSLSVRSIQI